jgi:UDP-N-acetylmuramoyl-tripeptide--D-alanyl-D-alanine ligase
MESMNLQEIIEVTSGRLVPSGIKQDLNLLKFTGVSIDSRSIQKGELFVALQGEHFDGHEFVPQALKAGGTAALVSQRWAETQASIEESRQPLILVASPLHALQELAGYYRRKFDVILIGITGTNGKTTTKDMTAAILSASFQTMRTQGNFNNHIGVPLTLFHLDQEDQMAVLEMGMSGLGEIGRLAEISLPQHGLITNIGPAHLLQLKSLDQITRAKFELLKALPEDGLAFLNADDERLMDQKIVPSSRVVSFGKAKKASYRLTDLRTKDEHHTYFEVDGIGDFEIPLLGLHNVYNALGAIAIGRELGVPLGDLRGALSGFALSPMRMERLAVGEILILNDAYNANPASMRAALSVLAGLKVAGRRIAVLGDMLELGPEEAAAHSEIGHLVVKSSVDVLVTVGELAREIARGAHDEGLSSDRIFQFADAGQAAPELSSLIQAGDVVLLKASRAVHLEEVLPVLTTSSEKG